jgi:rSAM/selenodomain-associated transferase 2
MISVVIPTLNAEATLAATLSALVPAAIEGLVREVVVVDAGSTDKTIDIVEDAGAQLLRKSGGRGYQLAVGAMRTKQPWLLFLHADTVLEAGWEREANLFMERTDAKMAAKTGQASAAVFRFALDDIGAKPRMLERVVAARCALLRLPYGDQGLLIPRRLYEEVGEFRPLPLMEDVDFVRRLGRRRVTLLSARAVTSAERYRQTGYLRRSARNLMCLTLYFAGVPTNVINRRYG